ncbi:hypothetical protein LZ30DRAFT_696438 [Colletotrichum cereale]|nr:hypothetical protein LZ30DRAFT_696438 [Colletotrichum cereale]
MDDDDDDSRQRHDGATHPFRITHQVPMNPFLERSRIRRWIPLDPPSPPPPVETIDLPPFPMETVSMSTDNEGEPSSSDTSPWKLRLAEFLDGQRRPEDISSRRESVESRTGGVPETPVRRPREAASSTMARRQFMRTPTDMSESDTSPSSPRARSGVRQTLEGMSNFESRIIGSMPSSDSMAESRGPHGRIVEIADETDGVEHTVSDGHGVSARVVETEDESDGAVEDTVPGTEDAQEGVHAAGMRVRQDGGGHVQPISRWKYPWVVLMLVLFMLFVPSYKDIF